MKNHPMSLWVAAAMLLTIPSIGFAQDKPAGEVPARAERGGRPGARLNPEERLKQLTETLGLTQEQQDQIKIIFENTAAAIKELMAKGFQNLTEQDRARMLELMGSQLEAVSAVLTPEQKEKLKAAMEKGRAEGWPGGPRRRDPAK
jgi:Spy/CpxP family protein refolding chaperone